MTICSICMGTARLVRCLNPLWAPLTMRWASANSLSTCCTQLVHSLYIVLASAIGL